MRLRHSAFVAACLCLLGAGNLVANSSPNTANTSKATINGITPSFFMSGDKNTCVMTGKNLKDPKVVTLFQRRARVGHKRNG